MASRTAPSQLPTDTMPTSLPVLASIEARGTSFRDYRDASGERGSFAEQLQAYGREGEACARCGRRLVVTHEIDGRSTVFCYACQR